MIDLLNVVRRVSGRTAALSTTVWVAAAVVTLTPAVADGRLSARYAVSVAGVEIGKANLVVEVGDTGYEIGGTGRVSGVMRAVSSGKGSVAVRGSVGVAKLAPRVFAVSAEADGKAESVRFAFVGPTVTDLAVEPPVKPLPDRVAITDAHLTNVIDPLSGAFVYVPGTVDMLSAAACDRTVSVFDGRQRYDVTLTFLRTEAVKIDKGFSGTAVVCRAGYIPVAGHRPTRSTVKYMQENKDMYVWLVPIPGSRFLAPFRVSVATMIGTALLDAVSFDTDVKEKPVPVTTPRQ